MTCLRLALVFGLLVTGVRADAPVRAFFHPDRIRYDGQCLSLNGVDVFVFSASFDYLQCPKSLWSERLRQIKEAGCNAVEVDVPWSRHERKLPSSPDDFSQVDLAGLKDWLRLAHDDFGLYTIIRPGPYLGGPWEGGGFPPWLPAKMPTGFQPSPAAWLRSDDPVFLTWAEHWMEAVCPTIAAEQIARKAPGHGGAILVQIENQYDLDRKVPDVERIPYLQALYRDAVGSGIEVPIFTCATRQGRTRGDPELGQVFDALNPASLPGADSVAPEIRALQVEQSDAPVMVCELRGGAALTPPQANAIMLLAIQEGATLLNGPLVFDGTDAVGPRYLAVAAIGRMLRQHGAALARSHQVLCQAETGSPDVTVVARRTREKATYLFIRNRSVDAPKRGAAVVWLEHGGELRVNYDLDAFGFKVLYLPAGEKDVGRGEWLPKP